MDKLDPTLFLSVASETDIMRQSDECPSSGTDIAKV